MSDAYKDKKAGSGGVVALVFVSCSLYLFASHGGIELLISLRAAVFVFVGMFASVALIGIPASLLQSVLARAKLRAMDKQFSQQAVSRIHTIGDIFFLVQIAVIFFLTKVAFNWFIV